jgi:hypothetical protein
MECLKPETQLEGNTEMSSFLMQGIPFLRTSGTVRTGQFLTALEEVLELGTRYVVRLGGRTAIAGVDDLLVGPAGLAVAGTSLFIPFDDTLQVVAGAPEHFRMPQQPPTAFRQTAFCYASGRDRAFGMIARDDDVEPGRHIREALTDAIGSVKKIASMEGRITSVTVHTADGRSRSGEGLTIDEDGFRSQAVERDVRWQDIGMLEITDRVRVTCRDAIVEIAS